MMHVAVCGEYRRAERPSARPGPKRPVQLAPMKASYHVGMKSLVSSGTDQPDHGSSIHSNLVPFKVAAI